MTTPQPGYDPAAAPPPTRPNKSHKLAWIVGVIVVTALLCIGGSFLIAALSTSNHKGDTPLNDERRAPVSTTATPPVDSPTTPAPAAKVGLTKNDVKLTLKTESKHCFGSAGCNLTLRVNATVDFSKVGDSTWDITYSIKGDESGPTIGTITLNPDKSYIPGEEAISTASSGTKVTVTVTEVEKVGF